MSEEYKRVYITDSWDWVPCSDNIARIFIHKDDVPGFLANAEESGFKIVPAVREKLNKKAIKNVTERKIVLGEGKIGRGLVLVFYVNSDRERKIRVCLNW